MGEIWSFLSFCSLIMYDTICVVGYGGGAILIPGLFFLGTLIDPLDYVREGGEEGKDFGLEKFGTGLFFFN